MLGQPAIDEPPGGSGNRDGTTWQWISTPQHAQGALRPGTDVKAPPIPVLLANRFNMQIFKRKTKIYKFSHGENLCI
jgi:hypothetical protein